MPLTCSQTSINLARNVSIVRGSIMRRSYYSVALILCLSRFGNSSELQQPLWPLRATCRCKSKASFDLDFDAFVEATLHKWHVPGLSIALVDNGEIVSKGYGLSVLPNEYATGDTQYMTGSTTKAFTAAAAAFLVHDNKNYPDAQWKSPIKRFIATDFVLEDDYATSHTTIEDALVHRTGLPRHDLVHGQLNDTLANVVQRLRYLPLTSEPRQAFQYCPLMYGVISHLLETITGRKLVTLLEDIIWKPLGMLSTTFNIPRDTSNLARGYYWHEAHAEYIPEPYDDVSSISGSGAIISTVNDYALWVKALLDGAASDDDGEDNSSPFTHSIVHDLFTPRIISDEYQSEYQPVLYALGWETITALGETIVMHGGTETGFGTQLYMLPGKSYGIITMANTEDTGNIAGAIIAERLLLEKFSGSGDVHKGSLISSLRTRAWGTRVSSLTGASSSRSGAQDTQSKALPAPLPIAEFAGFYSHPAYGTLELILSHAAISDDKILEGVFYPRTWPLKVQLSHLNSTVFAVRFFEPHGLGDIVTGDDIVWEGEENGDNYSYAIFEFGSDGESLETMGIELEGSMVEMARELGEGQWRKGMIWFEKR